jgi:hypothetical protein
MAISLSNRSESAKHQRKPSLQMRGRHGGDVNPATDANPPKTEHPRYGQYG